MVSEPILPLSTDFLKAHQILYLVVLVFGYSDRLFSYLRGGACKLVDFWFDLREHWIKRRREIQKLLEDKGT